MAFGFGFGMPRSFAVPPFSPASLFSGGAPGVWYDPSDYTTLFQDSVGTTPVTAVEQPVGLMLDKSQGLVLGPELVTNGGPDFVSTTGWVGVSSGGAPPTISVVAGWLRITANGVAAGWGSTVINQPSGFIAVTVQFRTSGSSSAARITTFNPGLDTDISGTSGTRTFYFPKTAGFVEFRAHCKDPTGYVEYQVLSVKSLPGNHAFQSTSASRPVLSARYNLLTKTEQFDDAVWVKDNVTVTANAVVAPDGTTTADRIVEAATTAFHRVYVNGISVIGGVNYTLSVYARAGERDFLALFFTNDGASGAYFNLANGTIGTVNAGFVASITSAGDGWYRCSISTTPSTSATFYPLIGPTSANGTASYAGDITKGIFLWGGQLEVST